MREGMQLKAQVDMLAKQVKRSKRLIKKRYSVRADIVETSLLDQSCSSDSDASS